MLENQKTQSSSSFEHISKYALFVEMSIYSIDLLRKSVIKYINKTFLWFLHINVKILL